MPGLTVRRRALGLSARSGAAPRRAGPGGGAPRGASAALVVALLVALGVPLLGAGPAHAAGERVALLPLEGSGLLTKTREDLDEELRKALAARGLEVQPKEATVAQIDEAQAAGLNCPTLTDACARRVGLVAEVDAVFRADVELVDDKMVLRVSRIDVHDEKAQPRTIAGQMQLPAIDDGASLRAVLARVVTGKGKPSPLPFTLELAPADAELFLDGKRAVPGVLWLLPGKHALAARAPEHVDLERELVVNEDGTDNQAAIAMTPVKADANAMQYIGLGLLGVGALALVGGGAAATAAEVGLNVPQPLSQRNQVQLLGRGALVTTAVGAGAAAIGGVFAAVGSIE
jgi:hypothetical protein